MKRRFNQFEAAEAHGEAAITSHEEVGRLVDEMVARARTRA